MKNIAIFASGGGSNAKKIIEYFKNNSSISVNLVVSNNPSAGVLSIADTFKIPHEIINKKNLLEEDFVLKLLQKYQIHFIVLAGYMNLVPTYLATAFQNKIVNIHPALLPKYGGQGMYGHFVHEEVFRNGEKESGISIHFVNENYDKGELVFQKAINIESCRSAEEIAKAVLQLEHEHYAPVIASLLSEI